MVPPRKETQPKLVPPTLKGLLSLPFRVCNPPPAVGKVRSCGVTPLVNIKLQDVLDRKHLPPLGLKDFEEWLLYVEKCPEYLYFILWLNEYSEKHNSWAADVKQQQALAEKHRVNCSIPNSNHLAMFYARAKQTFFMPNSSYELDLPSDVLAPFHSPDASQQPDPMLFSEVSLEVRQRLEKCLDRFVQAQMTNVGGRRVLCGMIAGCTICLLGAAPPLAVNFATGAARWLRLAALPALWLGLAILFAAFKGICLGVYVFGDLRQLHKFELARPPISKPQYLRKEMLAISLPLTSPPPPQVPIPPATEATNSNGRPSPVISTKPPPPPKLTIVPPSPVHVTPENRSEVSYAGSRSSRHSYASSSYGSDLSSEYDEERIEISGAMYDEDIIDGPATSPLTPTMNYQFPPRNVDVKDVVFTHTASFIHPYEDSSIDLRYAYDIEERKLSPDERQPLSTFDFDALPEAIITPSAPRKSTNCPPKSERTTPLPTTTNNTKEMLELQIQPPPLSLSFTSVMARIQHNCNPRKWFVVSSDLAERASPSQSPRSSFGHSGHNRPISQHPPKRYGHEDMYRIKRIQYDDTAVQKEFKKIQAVPPFAALTRILSPVVVRAHWEIVIKSLVLAFIAAWAILGSLLAVPPRR